MASLDFVFDILEKIEAQKIGYYFIAVQEEKNGDYKADVFFNFDNAISAESALVVNEGLVKEIKNKFGINSEKKMAVKKSRKDKKTNKPNKPGGNNKKKK